MFNTYTFDGKHLGLSPEVQVVGVVLAGMVGVGVTPNGDGAFGSGGSGSFGGSFC
jgi:hypothetical protein